jgi:hypothetical protein
MKGFGRTEDKVGMLLKRQFKLLAKLMTEIEEMALRMHAVRLTGLPLESVDIIARQANLSPRGAETLVAMIYQSEKIQLSPDESMLIPRGVVLETTAVELDEYREDWYE